MKSAGKEIKYSDLLAYFEGNASNTESNIIESWLISDESKFKCERCLKQLWDELDPELLETEVDPGLLLGEIHHSINLKSGIATKAKKTSIQRPSLSMNSILRNLGRAAAILLLPVMGYIGYEIFSQKMWINNQAETVYQEVLCPLAAQNHIVLPDGSSVILNNGSSLKFPVRFEGDSREVELSGEAFFDVKHSRRIPFIINTVGLDVKVLGTRVNVYSYPDEDYMEVTLESGSVELLNDDNDQNEAVYKMKPGQHAVFRFSDEDLGSHSEKNTDVLNIIDVSDEQENTHRLQSTKLSLGELEEGDLLFRENNTEHYTGWIEGKLILRNDPMPVTLKRLERWYNVKFIVQDEEVNDYSYRATFTEESLEQVLRYLSLTGPLEFEFRPRVIFDDGSILPQEIEISLDR